VEGRASKGRSVNLRCACVAVRPSSSADTTLLPQARPGTPVEFGFGFTVDANRSVSFTLHEVYLALAKTPIEGPVGVEASFEFRAAFNATAQRMMTVVLKNQQVGIEYG
jgi:hypothetical protein